MATMTLNTHDGVSHKVNKNDLKFLIPEALTNEAKSIENADIAGLKDDKAFLEEVISELTDFADYRCTDEDARMFEEMCSRIESAIASLKNVQADYRTLASAARACQ